MGLKLGTNRSGASNARPYSQERSLLFQVDVGKLPWPYVLQINEAERETSPEIWDFAVSLTQGTLDHRTHIDQVLNQLAVDWTVQRMANVDRAILRLATFEMLFRDDIPAGVSINEAVELAKQYGTEESSRFVNGILGQLARQLGDHAE